MLDKITIVIPTFKRYLYLLRLLKFFNQYGSEIQILVLDSTPGEMDNEELLEILSKDNVEFIKYDSDIKYWEKISDGTNHIKTKYATLCSDDDFLIPTALSVGAAFLEEHSDYSSAHGLHYLHSSYEVAKKKGFCLEPLYNKGSAAEQETALKRIDAYLSGKTIYYPHYALQRTDTFRLIWLETRSYVSDWNLHELFPCCLSLAYGKMMILPVLYASREPNTYSINNLDVYKRTLSKEKVEKAVEGISKHVELAEGTVKPNVVDAIKESFSNYLGMCEQKHIKASSENNNMICLLLKRLRYKAGIGSRIRYMYYKGVHPSIPPKFVEDFQKIKTAVLTAKLGSEALNEARKNF